MAVVETLIFPELITVIDNRPVKFNVQYQQLAPDSGDRLGRHPYYYIFSDIPRGANQQIVVNATSKLRDGYFKNNLRGLHFHSVKFGISQIRNGNTESKILFTSNDYETMRDMPKLEANDLRHEILDFINIINTKWPKQELTQKDIELNVNADRNEIEQWLESLGDQGYLTENRHLASDPFDGEEISTLFYKIDQQMRQDVETNLNTYRVKYGKAESDTDTKLKLFFSYSSKNKKLAGQIKYEFERLGIEVFLAHEDIKVSKEWEDRILQELRDCDIFLGLITEQFMISDWTYQEAGNAIGRGKRIISLIHGGVQKGFLKRYQHIQFSRDKHKNYIHKILDAILDDNTIRDHFIYGVIEKLKNSECFEDSIALAKILKKINNLDSTQINLIAKYSVENDQIYKSGGADKIVTELFIKNKDKIKVENLRLLSDKFSLDG